MLHAYNTKDLMDETVINWIYPFRVTYFIDNRRIVRSPSFTPPEYGPDSNPPHADEFCVHSIAAHKVHPQLMRRLYNADPQPLEHYVVPKINRACVHE
jgi:hypothetical protein